MDKELTSSHHNTCKTKTEDPWGKLASQTSQIGASKTAQQVKVFVAKPDEVHLILRPMRQKERTKVSLTSTYVLCPSWSK